MREYQYHATDATVEALRRLKAPWRAATLHARSLVVAVDDATIRLSVEQEDVESLLEVQRIRADVLSDAPAGDPGEAVGEISVTDLGTGRNDVVLFTGETWVEAPGTATSRDGNGAAPPQVIQLSGRAGQRPPSAAAVCTTTDAVVIAAGTGEGILIRIGARPLSLETVQDRTAIARFLVQRGYTAG